MARRLIALAFVAVLLAVTPIAGDMGSPVGVLFRDAPNDCITSDYNPGVDGSQEYIDGVEAVSARIHGDGTLSVSSRHARGHMYYREIWYEFGVPVETGADGSVSPEHNPPSEIWCPPFFTIEMTAGYPGGFLGMPVGASTDGADVFGGSDPTTGWLYTMFNTAQRPATNYVTVTRTSATTWDVEAFTTDVSELVATTKKGNFSRGYYCHAFQFTLRLLP